MEKIVKKIKQITKQVQVIVDDVTYINIVPDLDATYHVKISLTAESHDMGYFDVIEDDEINLIDYEYNRNV